MSYYELYETLLKEYPIFVNEESKLILFSKMGEIINNDELYDEFNNVRDYSKVITVLRDNDELIIFHQL